MTFLKINLWTVGRWTNRYIEP